MHIPAHEKVEKALYAWFLEARAKSILVDGLMLIAKAKWLAAGLGQDSFTDNTAVFSHRNLKCRRDRAVLANAASLTLDIWGSTCHEGKISNVRVSVLLAANMDGSRKLQPFVIGKARVLRCFKNCKQLPVRYVSNKKAWMTCQLLRMAASMGRRSGQVGAPRLPSCG